MKSNVHSNFDLPWVDCDVAINVLASVELEAVEAAEAVPSSEILASFSSGSRLTRIPEVVAT